MSGADTTGDPFADAGPVLHRTLQRQLRRLGLSGAEAPGAWAALLEVVSASYTEADNDRYMLERSIEVSSIEMRGLYDKLFVQAHTDCLTGLPNRSDLVARLDDAFAAAEGTHSLAVLFVDLDGFKVVNDTYGHAFGDALLQQVAQRIRATIRQHDDVARLGGDEFVITCQDDDALPAEAVATRLVAAIGEPFCIDDRLVSISASIGIAYAGCAAGSQELMRRADIAMYAAKAKGRARWVCFDERMEASLR